MQCFISSRSLKSNPIQCVANNGSRDSLCSFHAIRIVRPLESTLISCNCSSFERETAARASASFEACTFLFCCVFRCPALLIPTCRLPPPSLRGCEVKFDSIACAAVFRQWVDRSWMLTPSGPLPLSYEHFNTKCIKYSFCSMHS